MTEQVGLRNRKIQEENVQEETQQIINEEQKEEVVEEKEEISNTEEPENNEELSEETEDDDDDYESTSWTIIIIRIVMILIILLGFSYIFYVIKRDIIDAGPDEGFLYAQLLSKFCGDRECDERELDMIDKIMENYRSGKN